VNAIISLFVSPKINVIAAQTNTAGINLFINSPLSRQAEAYYWKHDCRKQARALKMSSVSVSDASPN
jgi:hypothetical protein